MGTVAPTAATRAEICLAPEGRQRGRSGRGPQTLGAGPAAQQTPVRNPYRIGMDAFSRRRRHHRRRRRWARARWRPRRWAKRVASTAPREGRTRSVSATTAAPRDSRRSRTHSHPGRDRAPPAPVHSPTQTRPRPAPGAPPAAATVAPSHQSDPCRRRRPRRLLLHLHLHRRHVRRMGRSRTTATPIGAETIPPAPWAAPRRVAATRVSRISRKPRAPRTRAACGRRPARVPRPRPTRRRAAAVAEWARGARWWRAVASDERWSPRPPRTQSRVRRPVADCRRFRWPPRCGTTVRRPATSPRRAAAGVRRRTRPPRSRRRRRAAGRARPPLRCAPRCSRHAGGQCQRRLRRCRRRRRSHPRRQRATSGWRPRTRRPRPRAVAHRPPGSSRAPRPAPPPSPVRHR